MLTRPVPASVAPLIELDEPPPYGVINPDGASDILLVCEHALPRIPRQLAHLGLPKEERLRHIGWDIGALALARDLSVRLDAALFHTNYSRLVVDCNRPLDNPSLIPKISETTAVPGELIYVKASGIDHLERLLYNRRAAIDCWLDGCGKNFSCDFCKRLYAHGRTRKSGFRPEGPAEVPIGQSAPAA